MTPSQWKTLHPLSKYLGLHLHLRTLTKDQHFLGTGPSIQKSYLAIVENGSRLIPEEGTIDDRIMSRSDEPKGMSLALTEFKVLARGERHSLLRLSPITGMSLCLKLLIHPR